jgi:hypothetical protein
MNKYNSHFEQTRKPGEQSKNSLWRNNPTFVSY